MKKKTTITDREIRDFQNAFKELSIKLESNKREFEKFKASPITYLRNEHLNLMKYINNSPDPNFVKSLSMSIRNFLTGVNIFDRCTACKIMALLAIYALLGNLLASINYMNELLGPIIEFLERVFNTSKEFFMEILKRLKRLADRVSIFTFAEEICRGLNKCA